MATVPHTGRHKRDTTFPKQQQSALVFYKTRITVLSNLLCSYFFFLPCSDPFARLFCEFFHPPVGAFTPSAKMGQLRNFGAKEENSRMVFPHAARDYG